MKKRLILGILTLIFACQWSFGALAVTDSSILTDPVNAVYTGSASGEATITNLDFSDVPGTYWAKEPITRLGALSVIKGYNEGNTQTYRPDDSVTNEEALALLLRVIGQEEAAVQAAQNLDANEDDSQVTIWSRGYLQIAANLGLITQAQLGEALVLDQTQLDPDLSFFRGNPATREQVAQWIVQAIATVDPTAIAPINNYQQIFNLDDWESAETDLLPYIEAVMEANIMVGDGTSFDPKEPLTRAQLAQLVVNMEDILYDTMGLSLKGGVVGAITENLDADSTGDEQRRQYKIRNNDGQVDEIELIFREDSQGRQQIVDVPVLYEGDVRGLDSLKEGDFIQYLVDNTTNEAKYVNKTDGFSTIRVIGTLEPFDNLADGTISIKNSAGIVFNYQMIDGLYDAANQTVQLDGAVYPLASMPIGNTVTLSLQNDVVTLVEYEGAVPLAMEVSGIVKEINIPFGFITVEDWNGGEVTKFFNYGDVTVEKQNFYDTEDEIGYIDEVYPGYGYDERDSFLEDIEVGDVVHLRLDPGDLQYVTDISAKTNYSVRFGQVTALVDNGANGATIRVVYDNNAIGNLDVPGITPVMLRNMNVGTDGLKTGQVVRLLMNQAVLAPGRTVETVKQIDIDPYGNVASNLYKGEFGLYNPVDQSISLLNSYQLTAGGWNGYTSSQTFDLTNGDLEIYYGGERIGLSYADRFLRTEDMNLFVVTEDHFGTERLAKLVFDEGRGDVLNSTNIAYTNGFDTIRLVSSANEIGINEGTIVVKDGHIVSGASILSPDYAQVVMGDSNRAVMVNVMQEPNNDAVAIFRGRIDSIEDGQQFNVESNARLSDMEWIYSPIEREFTMSYDTEIIDETGAVALSDFIDYSELSRVDEVYTILAEGDRATHLYASPYATEGVTGTIYNTDESILYIRDALVYDSEDRIWAPLSYTNNYAEITVDPTTAIIKNNEVVDIDDLAYGESIRVMTTEDLSEEVTVNSNRNVTGYIIFVE